MLGLLIETTSPKGGLALYSFENQEVKALTIKKWDGPVHSASITLAFKEVLPFLQDSLALLKKSQKNLFPPVFISLGVGPGRFTGVRVGISFVKTISFILGIPLYPISSLKIIAESQSEQEKPILVLLNAFKNSLYMALYQKKKSKLKELIPPCLVLPQDLNKHIKEESLCVGDGYSIYKDIFPLELKEKIKPITPSFPDVKHIASFLHREFDPQALISWKELKPLYLRSPVKLLNKKT